MANKTLPVLALALLLLLSGCLERLPEDQRLYCLDLTGQSYGFVPECDSQNDCFSKLGKKFFSFDHSVLGSQTREKLNGYRNNIAQSWLYFNNAKKNISQIKKICQANNNMAGLIFHLNELTHSMAKAFEYADKANRQSFEILALEQQDLNAQDIHLAREEPLFNDFAAIKDNLNSLNSKSCKKENLACFYLRQTASFEALVRQTGFEDRILSQENIFGIAEGYTGSLSELKIPLIGQAISPILSFLSNLSNAQKAIQGLEAVSAFQFIQTYGNFAGTSNSCLEKFSTLIKSDALNRAGLIGRNNKLEQQAWQGLEQTEQAMDSLLSEEYTSFDQNFFQSLYSGLGQDSTIAAQRYSIRDFGELHAKSKAKLSSLKKRLLGLQGQESLNQLSLGAKANALKQLNSEIALLKENLAFLSSEIINGLLVLCEQRAGFIEAKIEKASLPEDYLVNAIDLKARANFKAKLFKQAKGKEKLLQCREMVLEFERFEKALADFQEYELQEKLLLEECFSWLGKTFREAEQSGISLDSFLFRLQELGRLEKPYPDLSLVQRNCLSLKKDIKDFIERQPRPQNAQTLFSSSKDLFSSLEQANQDGLFPSSKLASLNEKLSYFQSFFPNGRLSLDKALPLLPDLELSLEEFHGLLAQETQSINALLADQNIAIQQDQNLAILPGQESLFGEISSGLDNLSSKLAEAKQSLSALESLFSKVSDETIIEAKYLPPISRKELEKARLNLEELNSFLEKSRLQDLNIASEKSLSSLSNSVDKKLAEAESLSKRLEGSFNAIKEDAVVSYNAAVELFNQGEGSQAAEDKISEAKDQLLKGNFLESIASSRNASGLSSLTPSAPLDMPLFAIPIVAGTGLVLAVRLHKKKRAKKKSELIKKIESNWGS